ncbi:MAG TPA: nickel-type superoxide dismutase maturation protease [Acidimicrobiales bacterium]|nr:nickel-type superoxide dismutase maturation protease [Acidimicrobiales bacterium]
MAASGVAALIRVRRLVVEGDSMRPGFQPGDRLLVVGPWPLRPGQVVALADPRTGRLLVKRVYQVSGDSVHVRGDNAPASTDSRHFGPVRRNDVVGRVVFRYAPAVRSGWWPG